MNIRKKQKIATRNLILKTATKLFAQYGFIKVTTNQIAEKANIAHGTLFLHFKNKDMLILSVFDDILNEFSNQINDVLLNAKGSENLLQAYLAVLQKSEAIFSQIAKELPFYQESLQRKIIFRESLIRNHFFELLKGESRKEETEIRDAVNVIFSNINYYLYLRDFFVKKKESVIGKFQEHFLQLLRRLMK